MIAFAGAMRLIAMQDASPKNYSFSVKPRWNLNELQAP
jgi:N6-L-threonylcarbamoyladenine synthase